MGPHPASPQLTQRFDTLQTKINALDGRISTLQDSFCPVCLPYNHRTPPSVDAKSVRMAREARFRELRRRWEEAKAQGMTHKIWETVGGPSVRLSHRAADKQKVPIDDKFSLGTERLFLPSDPTASFMQTANCRCDVSYVRENQGGNCPLAQGVHSNITVRALLHHYFNCDGVSIRVAISALNIPRDPTINRRFRNSLDQSLLPFRNRRGRHQIAFDIKAKFDLSEFGNLTMRLEGVLVNSGAFWKIDGQLSAYNDTYDFDPKTAGRTVPAEVATRVFELLRAGKGTAFNVAFVGSKPVSLRGRWDSVGAILSPREPRRGL